MSKLSKIIEKFNEGYSGKGEIFGYPIPPSEVNESACSRGIYLHCKNPVNCKHLYGDRSGIYCTNKFKKGRIPFVLALQEIPKNNFSRYLSIQDAIVREYSSSKKPYKI